MEVHSLFDVKDKVVLVTGGARGIGRMITSGFVANGARVYISSRDAQACETTAAELTSTGPGTCVAIPADLLKLSDCERLVSEISQREKKLHVLVNNSGSGWGASVDEFPDDKWAPVLTLNLQRAFTLTQLLLPLLEAASYSPSHETENREGGELQNPAAVINIGSINGIVPPPMQNFSYSAAKAGLHQLTRHLSQVLGPRGITVNTLACGPFETKMMKHFFATARDAIEEGNPMRRAGAPGDVAGACIYLASRAGSYVNGATINIDGGVHLSSKI